MNLSHKVTHYSVSSNKSFTNCAFGWWLDKVEGQKLPSSETASFGNQFDELITHRIGLTAHDKRDFDSEKPITEQVLLDGVAEAVDGYMLQPWAVKKGETLYAQKKIEILPHEWSILAEELGLCLEIKKPVVGYIDHIKIDGLRRIVVDQKTSKMKGMRYDWASQLGIYGIAENIQFGEIHLMTRTKVPAYYKYPVLIGDDLKRAVMVKFTYIANLIEKALEQGSGEMLPRTPDYWCNWCPAKLECPAKGIVP